MKKSILSLILVLMLLPIASVFSACGKNKSYDMSALDDEFFAIASENSNIELANDVLAVSYDNCGNNFKSVVSSISPYKELRKYNQIFYNIMNFSSLYIDECSSESLKISKEQKNEIQSNLDNLKISINEMNECTNLLVEIINLFYNIDVLDDVCLVRYENLLFSYEDVFEKAIVFHDTISNLYFNTILKTGNPNISSIKQSEFDASVVTNNLQARLVWQRSNLTQAFIEMYVSGGQLAKNIAENNGTTLNMLQFDYQTNIASLAYNTDAETAAYIVNNSPYKQQFYQLAIKAYNAQEILSADASKFVEACLAISFTNFGSEEFSAYESMCYSIINDYYSTINEYNTVLQGMVEIINL